MRRVLRLVLFASIVSLCPVAHSQGSANGLTCCSVVERALKDASSLKPGMTRSDVEKLFRQAGGMTFPGQTAYVYKDCGLIGLEVTYDIHPIGNTPSPFAPTDVVKLVSRLKIDYEPMD